MCCRKEGAAAGKRLLPSWVARRERLMSAFVCNVVVAAVVVAVGSGEGGLRLLLFMAESEILRRVGFVKNEKMFAVTQRFRLAKL